MIGTRIGHYRIASKLGEGGMGEIYRAYDEKLKRHVAVKLIAPSLLQSEGSKRLLLKEARAAAALNHPFICSVHDVLELDGQPAIVMECVEGETLTDRLRRGPLPASQLREKAIEICEALAAAHARGIIHRDVKSGNIMLTANGHVKVMDFGLAVAAPAGPEDVTAALPATGSISTGEARRHPREHSIVGTLAYMAPELLRGEPATIQSDLYAVGVVMYEMATARLPFSGVTIPLLLEAILNREVVPPRQIDISIPPEIDDLIVRLLRKRPDARPASALTVIGSLRDTGPPAAPAQRHSLGVLPFHSLLGDVDSDLGLGLADATISALSLVKSLLVRPTAAILRFAGRDVDAIEAGKSLAVESIVAGTFQKAGSRIRVSVQLISVSEARPLWSTKIDTSVDDIFVVQDEVARKVVDALKLELTPADEQRIAVHVQAPSAATELYRRGRLALFPEHVDDVNRAIELFEEARRIDPANPLPYVGLSDAYARLAFTWDPRGGWYERAKEYCDRALQIDPHLPEGRYMRGLLAWTPQGGFDHGYAIDEMVAALAERPNLSEAYDWIGVILFHVGLVDEAGKQLQRALAINPDDKMALAHLSNCELLSGRHDRAAAAASQAVEKAPTPWSYYMLVHAQLRLNATGDAERTLENAQRRFPGFILHMPLRAILAALRGEESRTRSVIEMIQKNEEAFGHYHHVQYDIGCALALLGRTEEALGWCRAAADNGFPSLPAFRDELFLASLRSHGGFQVLLEELKITSERYRAQFDDRRSVLSAP